MIPLATTTISVLRLSAPSLLVDPYDEPDEVRTVSSSGIRAHISSPSGAGRGPANEQEVVQWRLDSDIADITHLDWIQDEATSDVYRVVWVRSRKGLGLDHMEGGLVQVVGVGG